MWLLVDSAFVAHQNLECGIQPQHLDLSGNPEMASAGHYPKTITPPAKLEECFPAALDQISGLLAVVSKPKLVGDLPAVPRYVQSLVHGVPVRRIVGFVKLLAECDAKVLESLLKSGKSGAGGVEKRSVPIEEHGIDGPGKAAHRYSLFQKE
jgi:hypothetical protein